MESTYSDTTLKPFSSFDYYNLKSYVKASGTSPTGISPKSVNFAFENCNVSRIIGVLTLSYLITLEEKNLLIKPKVCLFFYSISFFFIIL